MPNTMTQQMIDTMSKNIDKFSKMSVAKIAKEFNVTSSSTRIVRKLFEEKGLFPKYHRVTLKDMVDVAVAETGTEENANAAEGVNVAQTA